MSADPGACWSLCLIVLQRTVNEVVLHFLQSKPTSFTKLFKKNRQCLKPSQLFIIYSVSPDLNLIIIHTFNPYKFPQISSTLKNILLCTSLVERNVWVCLSVCGSQNPAGNMECSLKLWQQILDADELCRFKHMQQLSVETEGQGFSVTGIDGL
jgi:hypothetical protein